MPSRYRFDLESSHDAIRDDAGVEASDLDQAIELASDVIREMQDSGDLTDTDGWTLIIRDQDGAVLKRIPL